MLIAQITDLHIVEKDKHWLSHPSTEIRERLERTIACINELNPKPDVVLMTGDMTDDGEQHSYTHLKELLRSLKIPFYMIPGNHDRRSALRAVFINDHYIPKEGFIHYVIEDHPVRLIGLDTLVEGECGGNLCNERMIWLEETLAANPDKPTLVFMHHPPIKIGMNLFDQMHCRAPSTFEKLIRKSDNVIGLLTGHYHHLCVSSFGGKLCYLAPSVAPVHHFAHPEHDYVSALELEDPGITLHKWHGGTMLTSHVVRVKKKIERIDWALIKKNG